MPITYIGITVVPGAELCILADEWRAKPTAPLTLDEALDFLDPFLEDGGSFVPHFMLESRLLNRFSFYGNNSCRIGWVN